MDATILLVEDDALLRDSTSFSLSQAGFRTQTASSLIEAVERLQSSRPSLVLLDLGLPDGSGVTLGRWLRALRIPFVIVTGHARTYASSLGADFGAEDYLIKPLGAEELVSRVTHVLQRVASSSHDSGAPTTS